MTTIVFHNTGEDYSAFVEACKWLQRKGYSFGFLEAKNPIGIIKGKFLIQRWSKLSYNQKAKLDGTIEFPYGNPRTENVILKLNWEESE